MWVFWWSSSICYFRTQKSVNDVVFVEAVKTVQDVVAKLSSINIVKDTAEMIRESLKEVVFGLDNRFCNAQEWLHSETNSELLDNFILFFASLCSFLQASLMKNLTEMDEFDMQQDNGIDINHEDAYTKQTSSIEAEAIKIMSLYQIMYYIFHNGRNKTPLQTVADQNVYGKWKSQELITTLNRIGVCSRYNEVRRVRQNLDNYCFSTSADYQVPIPSHFTPDKSTLAQMDNSDHPDWSSLTGVKSNHDTVVTFTQIKPEQTPSKPTIKDFDLPKNR